MMSFLKCLFLFTLTLSFVACGSSKEEKAQKNATNQVDEYNALVKELNASSVPNSSWSEQDLVKYEAKLSRLATLETQLDGASGKNGVTIIGGNNERFIADRRRIVSEVRAQKTQQTTQANQNKIKETERQRLATAKSDLMALSEEVRDLQLEVIGIGSLTSNSSPEDLYKVEEASSKIIANTDKMIMILSTFPNTKEKSDLLVSINEFKVISQADLELAQKLILESQSTPAHR